MSEQNRIDVHHHLLPPRYVEALRGRGITDAGGRSLPEWSVRQALTTMDSNGIATAVLSVSAPGVHFGDDGKAARLAREVNEFTAEVVKGWSDRFGFFATLTLPDVDGALSESAHAFDVLGADGVVLLANSRGTYLGDAAFEPLMAEWDRRRAVVFVHPAELPGPGVPDIPAFAADFLLDTTRAAYNLVRHEVVRRYPNIRFILAHAGGFVPYAAHRLAVSIAAETGRDPFDVLDDLAGFYFDTALSSSPVALPSLLAFAKPGRVLFGSDWPFAPDIAVSYFTAQLDSYEKLDNEQHHAIGSRNAAKLFPRFT